MSEKALAVPQAKKRAAVFKDMTPACQKVAKAIDETLRNMNGASVMTWYDVGAQVAMILDDEAKYGARGIMQVGEYLNLKDAVTTLSRLVKLAKVFDAKFVEDETEKVMADGRFLSISHWTTLAGVEQQKKRLQLLARTRDEALSVVDLLGEISADGQRPRRAAGAGRKPRTPVSAIAGLQQWSAVATKLRNMSEVMDTAVFTAIETMAPDLVSDTLLLRLKETEKVFAQLEADLVESKQHLIDATDRVQRVLGKQPAAKASANGKPAAQASANGKHTGKKPSANGHKKTAKRRAPAGAAA